MMVIAYRSSIQLFVVAVLVANMVVQSRSREQFQPLDLSRANYFEQKVFFAALNCPTDEEYEKEVAAVMRDPKCPKNVLETTNTLAMNMGDKGANRRIVMLKEKRDKPWTYGGRKAQGSLVYGTVWGLAGAAAWNMFGDTVKEFVRAIPALSAKAAINVIKQFTTG